MPLALQILYRKEQYIEFGCSIELFFLTGPLSKQEFETINERRMCLRVATPMQLCCNMNVTTHLPGDGSSFGFESAIITFEELFLAIK